MNRTYRSPHGISHTEILRHRVPLGRARRVDVSSEVRSRAAESKDKMTKEDSRVADPCTEIVVAYSSSRLYPAPLEVAASLR